MRGLLVAGISVAALALAGPASAAGMYWPSAGAPIGLWRTGFYAGLNAGGGWTFDSGQPRCFDPSRVENGPRCQNVIPNTANGSGFIGGGQIGYNWQVNPTWVAGLETDFQGSTLGGSATVGGPFGFFGGGVATTTATFTANEKLDWLGTVRGRLGFAIGRSLLYTTGGLAYGQVALNTNFVGPAFNFRASTTVTKVGWIAGIGTEGVFAGNWSAKLEALTMIWAPRRSWPERRWVQRDLFAARISKPTASSCAVGSTSNWDGEARLHMRRWRDALATFQQAQMRSLSRNFISFAWSSARSWYHWSEPTTADSNVWDGPFPLSSSGSVARASSSDEMPPNPPPL
jgi:outer membrane immunogenic protein